MKDKCSLKQSKYNVTFRMSEEEQVLFNFRTMKAVSLRQGEEPSRQKLAEDGFLIDADRDELQEIRDNCLKAIDSSEELALSIAPTMACQFACPYCFQDRKYQAMSDQVMEAIIRFVEKSFEKYGHKALRVHWFGGEPLMEIDRIEEITGHLKSICERYGATYRHFMVSNGYLLNQQMAKRLDAIGISYVRVTVDGPPEQHDISRVLKGGQGTFDRIEKNFRELDASVEIKIKTNLHRDNLYVVPWMKEWVKELDNNSKTPFSYSIAIVDCGGAVFDSSDCFGILSREEFERYLFENGQYDQTVPAAPVDFPCNSTRLHYYAIDENGNLYKCCDMLGRDEAVFGNVFDYEPGSLDYDCPEKALTFRENAFPDDDSECMECVLLPVCMGRCIRSRVLLNFKACVTGKGDIENMARQIYSMNKRIELL